MSGLQAWEGAFYGLPTPDPDVQRKAALEVCRRAVDVAEARELLDMLGLTPLTGAA